MTLREKILNVRSLEDLKRIKHEFYSKQGPLWGLRAQLANKNLNEDERRIIGARMSALRDDAEKLFRVAASKLERARLLSQLHDKFVDVTEPTTPLGALHPISLVKQRFREWLLQNGYYEMTGSDIVSDEYNFTRLRIDPGHPARDPRDSLYFSPTMLLRTHNTGYSALALEQNTDREFGQFAMGRVYRNDTEDQTHTHQFQQVDILLVGRTVSLAQLIWTLREMLSYVLEEPVTLRLRPSYFPFTTPSLEVDIYLEDRWVEVLGAGMIHPEVLKRAGYTNTDMRALAAGVGIERIAMIKYRIHDLREFYTNDMRFLKQFREAA